VEGSRGVAVGKFDIEKPRNFVADGFGNEPRHEARVTFQAWTAFGENGVAELPVLG
jgi:hypothetical protein